MKKTLVSALLVVVASMVQASVGGIAVTVSDYSGRLVYRGTTNADGTFATRRVAPGNYVVQFNARPSAVGGDEYAVVVSAGKNKTIADSVAGEQFTGGGIAMRVKANRNSAIVGQVASGGAAALGTKVINGTRYVLAAESTGTIIGPRWVEAGGHSVRNIVQVDRDSVVDLQYRGSGQNR